MKTITIAGETIDVNVERLMLNERNTNDLLSVDVL